MTTFLDALQHKAATIRTTIPAPVPTKPVVVTDKTDCTFTRYKQQLTELEQRLGKDLLEIQFLAVDQFYNSLKEA